MRYQTSQPELDPRRVWWDEKDCERLNATEYASLMGMFTAIHYAQRTMLNLRKRLESIPYGRERMQMAVGGLKAVGDDIVGTIPAKQARQIQNTFSDNELQFRPKMSPDSKNMVVDREIMEELLQMTKSECNECAKDDEECRECPLYQILTAIAPLEDYGNGFLCPYSKY